MLCLVRVAPCLRFEIRSTLRKALHPWRRGPLGREMPGLVRAAHAAALSICQEEHQQRRELCIQVSR